MSSAGLNVNVDTIDMAEKEVAVVTAVTALTVVKERVVVVPKEVVPEKEPETESRLTFKHI